MVPMSSYPFDAFDKLIPFSLCTNFCKIFKFQHYALYQFWAITVGNCITILVDTSHSRLLTTAKLTSRYLLDDQTSGRTDCLKTNYLNKTTCLKSRLLKEHTARRIYCWRMTSRRSVFFAGGRPHSFVMLLVWDILLMSEYMSMLVAWVHPFDIQFLMSIMDALE